jgi:hypothetical protein
LFADVGTSSGYQKSTSKIYNFESLEEILNEVMSVTTNRSKEV